MLSPFAGESLKTSLMTTVLRGVSSSESIRSAFISQTNRNLGIESVGVVGEGIRPEFMGIVNYGVIGLIQLEKGFSDETDITNDEALSLYDRFINQTKELMYAKNQDYNEAWRLMRISSYTDFILTKIQRTKEIESHQGKTTVSEGIDANYMDMINYALFGLIKLTYGE